MITRRALLALVLGVAVAAVTCASPAMEAPPWPPSAQPRGSEVPDPDYGSGEARPGDGLLVEYFDSGRLGKPVLRRIEPTVDFDSLRKGSLENLPKERLGIRWSGWLYPPKPGAYRLIVRAPGGVRLWFDGKAAFEFPVWFDPRDYEHEFMAQPERGYGVVLEFAQGPGKPAISLAWESEGRERQIVPATAWSPAGRRRFALPSESTVSPAFVELGHDAPPVATADGKLLDVRSLSSRRSYFDVPLNPERPTRLQVQAGKELLGKNLVWKATSIEGAERRTLRPGDALLIRKGAGPLRVEGPDGSRSVEAEQGPLVPVTFKSPGVHRLITEAGTLTVIVPVLRVPARIVAQVGALRTVALGVEPPDAQVLLSGSDAVTVGRTYLERGTLSASAAVLRRDVPLLLARVGGSAGPILHAKAVDAFALELPGAKGVLVNSETLEGGTLIRMRPWIPGLRLKVDLGEKFSFLEDGSRRTEVRTSDFTRFFRATAERTKETVGFFPYRVKTPPREREFCYEIEIWDEGVGSTAPREGVKIPLNTPPWNPHNICHVTGYRSLVFTRADDDNEDETESPRSLEMIAAPRIPPGCDSPRLPDRRFGETWKESTKWAILANEMPSGGAAAGEVMDHGGIIYQVLVSDPEPLTTRLDNPIPALFGGVSRASPCKPCKGGCVPVGVMHSGTIPGRYTTYAALCEEEDGEQGDSRASEIAQTSSGSAPLGSFIVSKVDAHGTKGGTSDRFPKHAEVLPKLAGYVYKPVIRMDYGGDRSVNDCSLYGTICLPKQNEWQFTAVAKDPRTGANLPPGYRIEWSGMPVPPGQAGAPTVKVVFDNPGRYFPTLRVFGPNPNGAGEIMVGKAEIHSIVVEYRPTCNVGEKNADVPSSVLKGTPFELTNHVGTSQAPVDVRLRVLGSGHPHPDFETRGRVSLDGYPQNEYWVGADDSGDLPQVATAPASAPQIYYLQGYQAASANEDDLRLQVEGQEQIEACASAFFYFDCTPCDLTPTGYPVSVGWRETDVERFSSSYPVEWGWDEPDLKYQEATPDVMEVQADHVAHDPEAGGTHPGYYTDKGYRGRFNFMAQIPWDPGAVHSGYAKDVPDGQALRLIWHAGPMGNEDGGPNYCDQPGLRDLLKPNSSPDASGSISAVLKGLWSWVQLDFTKLRGIDTLAKAGDRFCVVPRAEFAHSSLGTRFWKKRTLVVRPGDKVFHIVIPNKPTPLERTQIAAFDPTAMFEMSDIEFRDSIYKDWKWTSPLGSGETSPLVVYTFDRYRNPLPAGVEIGWGLSGGGRLGAYSPGDPEPQKDHPAELEGVTGAMGVARVRYVQERYPTCPWQMEKHREPAVIYLTADGFTEVATLSVVRTDEPLPELFPPLTLDLWYRGNGLPDPNDARVELLDIARGQGAVIHGRLMRGARPLEGVPIQFTSVNGRLSANVLTTNANGEVKLTLSGVGAKIDRGSFGTILVTGAVEEVRASISSDVPTGGGGGATVVRRSLPRWINSAPITVQSEHQVIVTDAFGATHVDKEALLDKGEGASARVAALGGMAGDDVVRYPVSDGTWIDVKGLPNHDYRVSVTRPGGVAIASGGTPQFVRARFPFDLLAQGQTPNVFGPPAAQVGPGVVVDPDAQEGQGSLRLDGSGVATIPSTPAVEAAGGLEFSFWIKPARLNQALLVSRPGQYTLESLVNGKLRLSTPAAQVESAIGLAVDRWSFVRVRLLASGAMLSLGADPGSLDTVWAAGLTAVASTEAVEVGRALLGRIDDLSFIKGIFEPTEASLVGTTPVGTTSGRTVTTDANGRARFRFQLASQAPTDYRPITYVISISGSGEGSVTVQALPKDVWASLQNVGRAFLIGEEGLGEHPSWAEKAAAWGSKMLPFVSDLRTLGMEIYKAASGCDSVSWMNVTFATVGLVADIATFGTAGRAVQASKVALEGTFKIILKMTLKNMATDRVFHYAMEGFVRMATVEVMNTDGTTAQVPAPWVVSTKAYLDSLGKVLETQAKEVMAEAFRSADELFVGLQAYAQLGRQDFEAMFEEARTTLDEVGIVYVKPEDRPEFAYAPLRGPPGVFFSPAARYRLAALPLVKTRPIRSQVLKAVVGNMADPLNAAIRNDKAAMRGLRKMVMMVVNGRKAESATDLALRVRRALKRFSDQNAVAVLKDFDELHTLAKTDPDLLKKVQDVARDFAARGKNDLAAKSRTKGATYVIQEATEGLRTGRLKKVGESIEPKAPPPNQNRLLRDLLEDAPKRYVELKAVENLSSTAVGNQMRSHFRRLPVAGSVADLTPIHIVSINAVGANAQDAIRKAVASAVQARSPGISFNDAYNWAVTSVTFTAKPLRYPLN